MPKEINQTSFKNVGTFNNTKRRYNLREKYELGKLIAKFKDEFEKGCQTKGKLVPELNKRQKTKPKDGFISKAIRHTYHDLKDLPSEDKVFRRALALGRRSYELYQKSDGMEPPKKRYKVEGGGKKAKAECVRMRLFSWFIGKKMPQKYMTSFFFS